MKNEIRINYRCPLDTQNGVLNFFMQTPSVACFSQLVHHGRPSLIFLLPFSSQLSCRLSAAGVFGELPQIRHQFAVHFSVISYLCRILQVIIIEISNLIGIIISQKIRILVHFSNAIRIYNAVKQASEQTLRKKESVFEEKSSFPSNFSRSPSHSDSGSNTFSLVF